jgi:hypothetical protein
MSRKKHRYKDLEPKPPVEVKAPEPEEQKPEEDQNIKRYKAVVRSPLGEWWQDNKKRVRLFAMIGGGVLIVGWLLFELFNLIF